MKLATLQAYLPKVRLPDIVKQTTLPNGVQVSAIEIVELVHPDGMHTIYETMVFPSEQDSNPLDVRRCGLSADALEDHAELAEKYRDR